MNYELMSIGSGGPSYVVSLWDNELCVARGGEWVSGRERPAYGALALRRRPPPSAWRSPVQNTILFLTKNSNYRSMPAIPNHEGAATIFGARLASEGAREGHTPNFKGIQIS